MKFVKTTIITGIAFGMPMGVLTGLLEGLARGSSYGFLFGLFTAVASGLAFGLTLAVFLAIQRRRFSQARPEFVSEHLLHDGPANHFFHGEGVGGWLYLTEQRLLFRSHKINIQPHELSVPLTDIVEVRAVRTAKIFPNGLSLVTRHGLDERFVVENHKKWCNEIARAQARTR